MKKQVRHEDILIELYRKHYEEEKQLRFVHANQRYELEQLLMEKVHSKQLKALDKQQKKWAVKMLFFIYFKLSKQKMHIYFILSFVFYHLAIFWLF